MNKDGLSKLVAVLIVLCLFLIVAIIVSSLGYCIPRFPKRFFVFWRDPFKNLASAKINMPRINGMVLPKWQADDFIQLREFSQKHTDFGEKIWMYPELGAIHFIIERPWVGKFPTATSAWFTDAWYEQYMLELKRVVPRYAIFDRNSPEHFEEVGLSDKLKNRFNDQILYLKANYSIISSTPAYDIYIRKNNGK
ncbi:MAG: hypothetical protein Q7S42_04540 [Candidatus Omnitrophota bacterium]|nr:hypothetical protein [Candidatus Omnitrophota bacterium]